MFKTFKNWLQTLPASLLQSKRAGCESQSPGLRAGRALTFQAVVPVALVVLQQGVAPLRGEIFPVPKPVGPSMIVHHVELLAGLSHLVQGPPGEGRWEVEAGMLRCLGGSVCVCGGGRVRVCMCV